MNSLDESEFQLCKLLYKYQAADKNSKEYYAKPSLHISKWLVSQYKWQQVICLLKRKWEHAIELSIRYF